MAEEGLTDLSIRKLAARPGQRYEVFDGKVPGFAIRVAPSGVKSFVVYYRRDGRNQRVTLGRFPILSLKEARRLAVDTLNRVAHGEHPQGERRESAAQLAFASVVDDFVRIYCNEQNRPSTARETERLLRSGFVSVWGDQDLRSIGRSDINVVLDSFLANGTPSAANHALSAIRKFFNWCVDRGILDSSPCASIKRPAPLRHRERALSEGELHAIWRATADIGYPYEHLVRLLILTAQRRGEVAGMQWDELDLKQATWLIPGARTKNKRSHRVPLSGGAVEILKSVPRTHPLHVFPARGNDETTFSGFSKLKCELDARAGLSENHFTLHDLRRSAATGMAGLGVAPHVIERILNHVSGTFGGVAGVYNRFAYETEMRHALELWAAHLQKLVGANSEKEN